MKPITPDTLVKTVPHEIIGATNSLIQERWDGEQSRFTLEELRARVAELHPTDDPHRDKNWFESKSYDVEPLFRTYGWSAEFDKSGYNESYDSYFIFKRGDKS